MSGPAIEKYDAEYVAIYRVLAAADVHRDLADP